MKISQLGPCKQKLAVKNKKILTENCIFNSIPKFRMTICQRFGDSCLLLRVHVYQLNDNLLGCTLSLEPYRELNSSLFNILFRNPVQLNLSFELGLQKMFMLFERSILEILKRRSNVFASKFSLRL